MNKLVYLVLSTVVKLDGNTTLNLHGVFSIIETAYEVKQKVIKQGIAANNVLIYIMELDKEN